MFCNQSCSKTKGAFVGLALLSFQMNHKTTLSMVPLSQTASSATAGPHYLQRQDLSAIWALWLIMSTAEMPSTHIHSWSSKSLCTCLTVPTLLLRAFRAAVCIWKHIHSANCLEPPYIQQQGYINSEYEMIYTKSKQYLYCSRFRRTTNHFPWCDANILTLLNHNIYRTVNNVYHLCVIRNK